MTPAKRNKILIGTLVVASALWYYMRPAPVDVDAVKAAYEASRAQMATDNAANGAKPAPPAAPALPAAPEPAKIEAPPAAPAAPNAANPVAPPPATPAAANPAEPTPAEAPAAVAADVAPVPAVDTSPGPAVAAPVGPESAPAAVAEAAPPAAKPKPKRAKRGWAALDREQREGKHDLGKPLDPKDWADVTRELASIDYEVLPDETLVDVARKIYGDSHLWPKLWSLNPQVENPYEVRPGTKLKLK